MSVFTNPVDSLSDRQRRIVIGLSLLVAITRIWGRAKSLWDWDEALFCIALTDYDVASHHPHPPGFPGYVALGRLIFAMVGDEFRSYQIINVAAGCALFPCAFLLARELRISFVGAIAGALFLAFAGNVWVFGGTAFSDVSGMVLLVASLMLLLRGCRSTQAFMAGSIVSATALTFRPQLIMILWLPWVISGFFAFKRRWHQPFAALVVMASIGAAAYGTAAYKTGLEPYRSAVKGHKQYLVEVDSYKNPNRLSLRELVSRCFLTVTRAGGTDYIIDALAVAALIAAIWRRRWHLLLLFASFLPFILFAWFMLDVNSFSRYGISYVPLYTLLAGAGVELVGRIARNERTRAIVATGLTAMVVAPMIAWSAPAVYEVRTRPSPPVRAIKWLRKHADRERDTIIIQGGLVPHTDFLMSDFRRQTTADADTVRVDGSAYIIADRRLPMRGAVMFSRPRKRLWKIVRRSYFDVTVVPATNLSRYVEGWHVREASGDESWRWMARRATVELPAVDHERLLIRVNFAVPSNLLDERVVVTFTVNGKLAHRVNITDEENDQTFAADVVPGKPTTLTLETSHTINPQAAGILPDPRDLGLRVRDIVFEPIAK